MVGIPFKLVRQGDESGTVDKTVYLATRRRGEAGEALRNAIRAYVRTQHDIGKVYQRYITANARLEELAADHERVDEFIVEREKYYEELADKERAGCEQAETVVRLSLTETMNKGPALDVLDMLTDADLHEMCETIQTGAQPSDFTKSRELREKSTSTSRPGESQHEPSSSTDSPEATLPPEE